MQKRKKRELEYNNELLALQLKLLSAQMNPHFIFNCLNSIKSLVQMQVNDQAIEYLNLFAKLLRNLMQYSEKNTVSLVEELDICRWYVQLETLRFGDKVKVDFSITDEIDFKLIDVPVLLIQPFIENAIWHGLVPANNPTALLKISVIKMNDMIVCTIDDNGIGRAAAMRMTAKTRLHQSKGMSLSQKRINMYNAKSDHKIHILIEDKFDDLGEPSGTTVIINFKNEAHD